MEDKLYMPPSLEELKFEGYQVSGDTGMSNNLNTTDEEGDVGGE